MTRQFVLRVAAVQAEPVFLDRDGTVSKRSYLVREAHRIDGVGNL